jgi:hypothetical protein
MTPASSASVRMFEFDMTPARSASVRMDYDPWVCPVLIVFSILVYHKAISLSSTSSEPYNSGRFRVIGVE